MSAQPLSPTVDDGAAATSSLSADQAVSSASSSALGQHEDVNKSSSSSGQAMMVDDSGDQLSLSSNEANAEDDDDEDNNHNRRGISNSVSIPIQHQNNHDDNEDDIEDEDEEDDDDGADHAEDTANSVPWEPQTQQSTCEFTHIIENYSSKRESGCKKAEYSSTTVDEFGNRWRLIVYVNGNGRASNHHLSLFLQVADADDLPFGWKKAVSYVLTLEHPSGSSMSYAKRNPDKTFKLCPKAIDWGWSQFITSDKIQQEGFVDNDSLTVRASVTVKSSSVSIDEEDSELYLKCAVEESDAEAVKLCLAQGASVNCKFKDDLYTPLHTACSSSSSTGSSSSGSSSGSPKEAQNSAASMEVLELLLAEGADGNACNKWRETPLLIAANNGHRSAVEALLKHGADPSLCSEAGWSALTFAAHKGYDDIVALLLRAGAPVNSRVTEDSSTPLHKACAGSKQGHLAAVKLLLDGGADVHALNKWRETPLLTAANHGQSGAVDALLRNGADPCKCTDTGWSPLSIAAYKGHDEVVKLLLEEGAPTEEADPTLSALLQAATKGLPDTVELLLRHGADHTVTTKKGDTALSILVEQNLIDAAVEMVTEYKASIPRCSRDRKKVQRARLLINLRIKQQEREGKLPRLMDGSDDETDSLEDGDMDMGAQHQIVAVSSSAGGGKKKKKKKGKKVSAEEQAKAAEEALLLELEQEESEAKKQEQEANKKSAKKKKKKERERQQKMKEEQERLERERKEQEERDRVRREKEEKQRQEQAKKAKEQREREMKEAAERERIAAQKRKEREDKERKLQLEKKKAELAKKAQAPPPGAAPKATKNAKSKTPVKSAQPLSNGKVAASPAGAMQAKTRGWETKAQSKPLQASSQPSPSAVAQNAPSRQAPGAAKTFDTPKKENGYDAGPSEGLKGMGELLNFDSNASVASNSSNPFSASSVGASSAAAQGTTASSYQQSNEIATTFSMNQMELPAAAIFRMEKLAELFQRCSFARSQSGSSALGTVDEATIKKVIYRWSIRAAHESSRYLDCLIPSWTDFEQLTAFFQRQFISENRKGSRGGGPMTSMEALREAGAAVANLCHAVAKEVAAFRQNVESQESPDWNDASIRMNASETMRNGTEPVVVIDWANRSQVYLTASVFTKLRSRYTGPQNRMLASMFVAKMRYDSKRLVNSGSSTDVHLPAAAMSTLATVAGVSGELWSDMFSAQSNSVFWGQFEDVDSLFGGLAPFSKEGSSADELLLRNGGSVACFAPPDSSIAGRYVHRIVDLLGSADNQRLPLSFAVVFQSECFLDSSSAPSLNDLNVLDPRLRQHGGAFLQCVKALSPGQHIFESNDDTQSERLASKTGSLFVLFQNDAGRARFPVSDAGISDVLSAMGPNNSNPSLIGGMSFGNDYSIPQQQATSEPAQMLSTGYNGFDGIGAISTAPMSPPSNQQVDPTAAFGSMGGTSLPSNPFAAPTPPLRGTQGRLFDLVDDGDDNINDLDVVSGMLGSLNVDDLFQNTTGQDLDVEAISLLGIGGSGNGSSNNGNNMAPRNTSRHFG